LGWGGEKEIVTGGTVPKRNAAGDRGSHVGWAAAAAVCSVYL